MSYAEAIKHNVGKAFYLTAVTYILLRLNHVDVYLSNRTSEIEGRVEPNMNPSKWASEPPGLEWA